MTEISIGSIYRLWWNSDYGTHGLEVYDTCPFNCKYCYGKAKKKFRRSPLPYVLDVVERQLGDCPEMVSISQFTDPYGGPNGNNSDTRKVLELFNQYGCPFSILTKAGSKSTRDFDLYFPRCRYGATLTCTTDAHSKHWEPGAALPADRIASLKMAFDAGIDTFVSLEPVLYPKESIELITMTSDFVNHYYLGKLNHYPEIEKTINWYDYKVEAKELLEYLGADYTISDKLDGAAWAQR